MDEEKDNPLIFSPFKKNTSFSKSISDSETKNSPRYFSKKNLKNIDIDIPRDQLVARA